MPDRETHVEPRTLICCCLTNYLKVSGLIQLIGSPLGWIAHVFVVLATGPGFSDDLAGQPRWFLIHTSIP